jgi:hypothetical protein
MNQNPSTYEFDLQLEGIDLPIQFTMIHMEAKIFNYY